MMLALVCTRMNLEVYETTREDVDIYSDMLTAEPKRYANGVRFRIKLEHVVWLRHRHAHIHKKPGLVISRSNVIAIYTTASHFLQVPQYLIGNLASERVVSRDQVFHNDSERLSLGGWHVVFAARSVPVPDLEFAAEHFLLLGGDSDVTVTTNRDFTIQTSLLESSISAAFIIEWIRMSFKKIIGDKLLFPAYKSGSTFLNIIEFEL